MSQRITWPDVNRPCVDADEMGDLLAFVATHIEPRRQNRSWRRTAAATADLAAFLAHR